MTEPLDDARGELLADAWLIVKRDLYFRPGACGYTGIRDEAGRYSLDEAKKYEGSDGITIVRLADAPEFRKAAYTDLVIKHLTKQRDEARAVPVPQCEAEPFDDPSTNASWNNGADFAMIQLCKVLSVDPESVSWDAATETVDGDVRSVIGNIMRAKYGEDWDAKAAAPPSRSDAESVEAIARVLYECEKRRATNADMVIKGAFPKASDALLMEPWEDCKDCFLSDAQAVLTALVPPPSEAGREEIAREARAEDIAIEICLSYGRDPDDPAPIMEMCDGDNQPVPTWMVYAEQAEAILEKFKVTARAALSPDPGTVLNQGTIEAPGQRSGQPSAGNDAP